MSWGTILVILTSPRTPNRTPWGPDLDDGKRWYSGGRFSVRAIAIKGGGSGRREAKNQAPLLTLGVGLEYLRFFQGIIGYDFLLPLFSPEMSLKYSACHTFRASEGSDGVLQNPP